MTSGTVKKYIVEVLSGIDASIKTLQRANSNADALRQLPNEFEQTFNEKGFARSSREAQIIQHIGQTYGWQAGTGAAECFFEQLRQGTSNQVSNQQSVGIFLAHLTLEGVDAKGDYQPVKSLHAEWEAKLKLRDEEFESLRDEKTQALDDLEERYQAIKRIQEPASYWRKKLWVHRGFAALAFLAFVAVAVIGGWALLEYISEVQTSLLGNGTGGADGADATVWTVLPRTFPVLLISLGLFWFLRILVRVFFTQMHLMSDASERVVLINTYLAMWDQKETITTAERLVVWAQVFRHESTGFYDDAAPEVPFKALTELSEQKKPTR